MILQLPYKFALELQKAPESSPGIHVCNIYTKKGVYRGIEVQRAIDADLPVDACLSPGDIEAVIVVV